MKVTRRGEIKRVMKKLEWNSYPRSQMFFLVMLTGAAGMVASYVLLRVGVDYMPARYALSVGCAYIAFLLLLWLWLRAKAKDYLEAPGDLPFPQGGHSSSASTGHDHVFSGGGGQFGGAERPATSRPRTLCPPPPSPTSCRAATPWAKRWERRSAAPMKQPFRWRSRF